MTGTTKKQRKIKKTRSKRQVRHLSRQNGGFFDLNDCIHANRNKSVRNLAFRMGCKARHGNAAEAFVHSKSPSTSSSFYIKSTTNTKQALRSARKLRGQQVSPAFAKTYGLKGTFKPSTARTVARTYVARDGTIKQSRLNFLPEHYKIY